MKSTNLAFLRIAKRAERQDDAILQRTFVDFGAVFTAFSALDHQILFGRRGTGKTHLLTVLRQSRRNIGEIAIQIDMRHLGSAGGIYADPSIPLTQRATRLLIDLLSAIHGALFEQAVEHDALINLGITGDALDLLFEAHTNVKVVGITTVEDVSGTDQSLKDELKLSTSIGLKASQISASSGLTHSTRVTNSGKKSATGKEVPRVNFGNVGHALKTLVATLPNNTLWLLIDEWSEVPLDLQPYLADLIRRAVLPTTGITVKIAAIEQRSHFLIPEKSVGNIGLEIGADISAAINLDEYMVFDNNETLSVTFFRDLVLKHVQAALEIENKFIDANRKKRLELEKLNNESSQTALGRLPPDLPFHSIPASVGELLSHGFTQTNAFDEVVRACEGVPRDAIHILSHAAQRAGLNTISVNNVRVAARQWYQASKDAAVSADSNAKALLVWIVDKVIKERQTKGFLLKSETQDVAIDFLYDERVLHVLRKGVSSNAEPSVRYNLYAIDYGCYIDLINTAKAPKGILDEGEESAEIVDAVPRTDLRSIRRCVLDLNEFYQNVPPVLTP